jgi:hypothetical protein
MAQATVTVTYDDPITQSDSGQHSQWMYGTITVSASPTTYATGGLSALATGGGINWTVGDFPKVRVAIPKDVYFYSAAFAGTTVGGYGYVWNKTNNTFQIAAAYTVTSGTGPQQTEMTNGTAIPANVSNDTIRFEARFVKAVV